MKIAEVFAALCFSLLLFTACKKREDGSSNGSATARILEGGKWQMTAATATVNYMGEDTTVDLYSQMDDCDKDDFILFAANGNGTIDENTNKCIDDQQIENFSWMLLNNDTKLALIDSNPDTVAISQITASQMVLTQVKPNSSGSPVTTIRTYKNIR